MIARQSDGKTHAWLWQGGYGIGRVSGEGRKWNGSWMHVLGRRVHIVMRGINRSIRDLGNMRVLRICHAAQKGECPTIEKRNQSTMWKNKCGWGPTEYNRIRTTGRFSLWRRGMYMTADLQLLQRVLRSNGEEYILEWVRWGLGQLGENELRWCI